MNEVYYLVWLETREINCVGNSSALTNSLYGIYFDKGKAIEKAYELTDEYSEKVECHIGSVCGGYYDGFLVWVYEAKKSDVDGKLVPVRTIYKRKKG